MNIFNPVMKFGLTCLVLILGFKLFLWYNNYHLIQYGEFNVKDYEIGRENDTPFKFGSAVMIDLESISVKECQDFVELNKEKVPDIHEVTFAFKDGTKAYTTCEKFLDVIHKLVQSK